EHIAKDPEQGRVALDIDVVRSAVDVQRERHAVEGKRVRTRPQLHERIAKTFVLARMARSRSVDRDHNAALEGAIRSVLLNGLNRQATAPFAMRRGRSEASPCAVMKTIGIASPRRINSCWRAGPLMPGKPTSRIRQSVARKASDSRNASAEA